MYLHQAPNFSDLDIYLNDDDKIERFDIAASQQKEQETFFPTRFSIFDEVMGGGVSEGDLIIVSGRTGDGKTTLAQTFTYQFTNQDVPCLWFTYEVSIKQLWKKFQEMSVKPEFVGYVPLKMTSGSVEWITHKIKEGILKFKTKVIFIDHLGFLTPNVSYDKNLSSNYSQYLTACCRQLKSLAISEGVIIFLLAHLRKTDKEADVDDLAYSAGIAQESDFVFFIERKKQEAAKFQGSVSDYKGQESEIRIVKNRRTGQLKRITCCLKNGKFEQIGGDIEIPKNLDNLETINFI